MPGQKIDELKRKQQILAATMRVATEMGLEKVTGRRVAAEAQLSSGSIFFHYKTKDELLLALLDELIAWWLTPPKIDIENSRSRFLNLIRLETQIEDRAYIDLLLEFWILGRNNPEMRSRLRDATIQYRARFCLAAQQMIREDDRLSKTTPESIATFASSLVIGNALQMMFDTKQFDTEALLSVTNILFAD